ncbi:MAG: hypothetical protein EpisKO_01280 [Epibacterium sp.]
MLDRFVNRVFATLGLQTQYMSALLWFRVSIRTHPKGMAESPTTPLLEKGISYLFINIVYKENESTLIYDKCYRQNEFYQGLWMIGHVFIRVFSILAPHLRLARLVMQMTQARKGGGKTGVKKTPAPKGGCFSQEALSRQA